MTRGGRALRLPKKLVETKTTLRLFVRKVNSYHYYVGLRCRSTSEKVGPKAGFFPQGPAPRARWRGLTCRFGPLNPSSKTPILQ